MLSFFHVPNGNLRKREGEASFRGLYIVRDGEVVVEERVGQLKGEVSRVRAVAGPCESDRATRDRADGGADGHSGNKGKGEGESESAGNEDERERDIGCQPSWTRTLYKSSHT
jgi:hypothetical protein